MANLNTNTTDVTNVLNEKNDIACSTLECSNKNYVSLTRIIIIFLIISYTIIAIQTNSQYFIKIYEE